MAWAHGSFVPGSDSLRLLGFDLTHPGGREGLKSPCPAIGDPEEMLSSWPACLKISKRFRFGKAQLNSSNAWKTLRASAAS